ncbi:hypothetical protein EYF80_003209 [Liparis tanakae]|uniref:Uncharacterized protein n=1 Tax=Liparis tanakae TaxID=230148 RepID=A0A4Z2J8E6_9TELE|nr:hypothetical protein EYF80_003209 [Liparis tanakae]
MCTFEKLELLTYLFSPLLHQVWYVSPSRQRSAASGLKAALKSVYLHYSFARQTTHTHPAGCKHI